MKPSNKKFIVYKVTSPSKKIYIGITCEDLIQRKSKHLYTSKRINKTHKFSNAIKKYGIDGLEWTILHSELTQKEAIELEKKLIVYYNSYKEGYNSTLGGEGAWGVKWKKLNIERQTEKLREKYYNDPEWKKKRSKQTKLYYQNNPEKAKEAGKRLKRTPEQEKLRIKNTTCHWANLKRALTLGCKFFNVYDFTTQKYIGTWLSRTECAKTLGLSNGKISSCLKKKRNSHKTYIFKSIDDPSVINNKFNPIWLEDLKRSPNVKNNTKEK